MTIEEFPPSKQAIPEMSEELRQMILDSHRLIRIESYCLGKKDGKRETLLKILSALFASMAITSILLFAWCVWRKYA